MSDHPSGAHISRETFDHLVDLAELELNEKESVYLLAQMNAQLKAVRELESIPLSENTMGSTHGVVYKSETTPPLRSDQPESFQESAEIITQSPQHDDGYIIVPDIPHTTLE